MNDNSNEIQEPPRKVQKMDQAKQTGQRFGIPKSNAKMIEVCKGFVPDNMKKNTGWVLCLFFLSGDHTGARPFPSQRIYVF